MSTKNKKLKIVLLGAPSAGKGTQAEILSKELNIIHLSTGSIFRSHIERKTKLGKLAEQLIQQGKLVPDDITNKIVMEKLKKNKSGFILDGYPRNLNQAQTLQNFIKIDFVIDLEVGDQEVIHRLSGRRICPSCNLVYHLIYKKPLKKGICDQCGKKLIQRKDDSVKVIEKRLKVHHQALNPMLHFYQNLGLLVKINGEQAIKKVNEDILEKLNFSTKL